MRVLAVVAQTFAMIAGNHDDRHGQHAPFPDRLDEARDLCVGVRHFAVVGVATGFPAEIVWRVVGRVRVVEMHPQKEG